MSSYEVNHTICEKVLKNFDPNKNYEIAQIEIGPFSSDINGYLGVHQGLNITIKSENGELKKLKFFVKHIKISHQVMNESRKIIDMFEKEKFIYTSYSEEISKNIPKFDFSVIPKCYYAENGVIVLEDLTQTGFDLAKSLMFDKIHVEVALKALAKFHAGSLALEEAKSKEGTLWRLDEKFGSILEEGYFRRDENFWGHLFIEESFRTFLLIASKVFKRDDAAKFSVWLKSFIPKFYSIFNDKNNFRKVCSHGDFWAKNMLFKYNKGKPVDCKLIDFQILRYAPPGHDVTFLIVQATSTEIRLKYYKTFLDFYYNCLDEELSKLNLNINSILPKDEFEKTCKIYKTLTKLIRLAYNTINNVNKSDQHTYYKDETTFYDYFFYNRKFLIDSFFETDNFYRKSLTVCINELYEDAKYQKVSIEDFYFISQEATKKLDLRIQNVQMIQMQRWIENVWDYFEFKLEIAFTCEKQLLNLFVKSIPSDNVRKNNLIKTGIAFKEHLMFSKIIPYFKANGLEIFEDCFPKCYLSRLNDVLVFEDLAQDGYIKLDSECKMNLSYVEAVTKSIAKMHVSSLVLEYKRSQYNPIDVFNKSALEIQDCIFLKEANKYTDLFSTALDYFFSKYAEHELNILKEEASIMTEDFDFFLKKSDVFTNVLCHGNLTRGNVMFKLKEEKFTNCNLKVETVIDCKFTNFHSYEYLPPAFDLMIFIYSSTSKNFRKENLDAVIRIYYTEMKSILKQYKMDLDKIIPMKEFLNSCDFYKKFAIWKNCIERMKYLRLRKENKIFKYNRRENISTYIFKMCNKNLGYKEWLQDALLDFKECVLGK